jgi:C-terminal processing protease CtpA/Prc
MPLADGQALKITTSRYFTPAGISINGVGIVPDTVLDGAEQPPADMDTADHATLAQRDPQVSVALQALSTHTGLVAGRVGADATR